MHTKYLTVCAFLISVSQNYGMSSFLTRTKSKLSSRAQSIRSKVSDNKPRAVTAIAKTIKNQQDDIIQTQTREFHEKSPKYTMGRALGKSMIFNALAQSALSYYNILAFTAIPLPISILLGGALIATPAFIFDSSEILKRHWNYWKQKRLHDNSETKILQKLLDRVTITEVSEKEPILIQEADIPKELVNKALLPGEETILQAALKKGPNRHDIRSKSIFWLNIKALVYAGADPNLLVPDEAHPINILLKSPHADLETLALFVNPMIVPENKLKALPEAINKQVQEFVKTKKSLLKDHADEWSQNQINILNSIESALKTRKNLLWTKEVTLKKQSQPISPIDL